MQPVSPVHSYSKVAPDGPEPTEANGSQPHRRAPAGYAPWFVVITALLVTALVTANIIAVKPVTIFALLLPAAIIIFPASYPWATCSPRSTATAKRGA